MQINMLLAIFMNAKMQIEHMDTLPDGWAKLNHVLLRWARNRSERRILENTEGGKDALHAPGPKLRALPAVIFRQEKRKVKRLFYVIYAASYR